MQPCRMQQRHSVAASKSCPGTWQASVRPVAEQPMQFVSWMMLTVESNDASSLDVDLNVTRL